MSPRRAQEDTGCGAVWLARLNGVQEAGGSSPPTPTITKETGTGHHKPAAGHFMPESGHTQRNLESPHAEHGTSPALPPAPCGQFPSTIRAQSEHNEHSHSTMADDLPVDLQLVVGAWERLPDVVRAAIVGMVKGTVKAK